MAGYGGGHPDECPTCGSPPWESCGWSPAHGGCTRLERQHGVAAWSNPNPPAKQRYAGGVLVTNHELTMWDSWGAESIIALDVRTHYRYSLEKHARFMGTLIDAEHSIRASGDAWRRVKLDRVEDEQVRAILRAVNQQVKAIVEEAAARRCQP